MEHNTQSTKPNQLNVFHVTHVFSCDTLLDVYAVHPVMAGRVWLDGGAMFGVVPKTMWSKAIPPDPLNRIPLAMRCLLLLGQGRVILVDAGITNGIDDRFRARFTVEDDHGAQLIKSLSAYHITPEQVTDVVLTHLHFDHGSGVVRLDNPPSDSQHPQLTFPNARHYVQKTHLYWAFNPAYRERASFLRGTIMPMVEHGKLTLGQGSGTVLPGVEAVVSNGHTIGMQYLRIRSANGLLVYCTDVMPTSHHLGHAYNMGYDLQPLIGTKEKLDLLTHAVDTKATIIFEHDDTVPAIRVERDTRWFRIIDTPPFS